MRPVLVARAFAVLLLVAFMAVTVQMLLVRSARCKEAFDVDGSKPYVSVLHVKPASMLRTLAPVGVLPPRAEALLRSLEPEGMRVMRVMLTTRPDGAADAGGAGLEATDALTLGVAAGGSAERAVVAAWPLEPATGRRLYITCEHAPGAPETLSDLAAHQNARVECLSSAAVSALRAVARIAGIREGALRIASPDEAAPSMPDSGAFRAVCAWASPAEAGASPALQHAGAPVVVVSYEGDALDPHRLAAALPWAASAAEDVRLVFPMSRGAQSTMGLLAAPALLAADPDVADAGGGGGPLLRLVASTALQDRDVLAATSQLELAGLALVPSTRAEVIRRSSDVAATALGGSEDGGLAVGRAETPILEQFAERERRLELQPRSPVPGLVTQPLASAPSYAVLAASADAAGGAPMRVGDRVDLSAQPSDRENGKYVVTRVASGGALLETAPRLDGYPSQVLLEPDDGVWRFSILVPDALELGPGDRVVLKGRAGTVVGTAAGHERTVVVELDEPDMTDAKEVRHSDKYDPLSFCWPDRTVPTRELCEAQHGRGAWDRPCRSDAECPFFQANRRYANYRGGCIAGHCELPVGVRKTSFRGFAGKPMCHGCAPEAGGGCCADQGASPDYAFELDQFERAASIPAERGSAGFLPPL